MEPVRVLHIEITSQIGGIERFLYSLYQSIDRSLVQFDFVTTAKEPAFATSLEEMGARIFTVASYTKNPLRYYSELKRVLQQGNYKMIHIHKNSAANILPVSIGGKLKTNTVIVHSHNTASTRGVFFNLLHHLNKGRLARSNVARLACSESAGVWLFGKAAVATQKITFIRNGIDTDRFRFNKFVRQAYRSRLNLNGRFVIGHVGRFTGQKNHGFLLDVFKEVYSKNPQAVLLLVGSGELEPAMREKADKLGIAGAVQFLGVRQDVAQLMQAMDVFLFPSRYEGLGIVVIEAQAAGLRCVASNTIPREASITDLLTRMSLRQPVRAWADEILRYQGGYTREDTSRQIIDAGYSCTASAKSLQDYYLAQSGKTLQTVQP